MRLLPFGLGLAVLSLVWLGPLQSMLRYSFAAHMSVHMAVVAVAAPLLAIGLAGSNFDPVRRAPHWFPPVPASVLELLVVWAWHTPALHHAARHTAPGLLLEQGSFLLSALYVWLAAFGGDVRAREDRVGAGVVALLLTSMHMTLLGALLALPPRPLYDHASHQHASGSSGLDDQHLGGAIMLVAGGTSYLAGGLWLTLLLLRRRRGNRQEAP
ncbi:MAG TPA: cytochrome c oxidase assembly protein [Polyangiaceae bacterium]|nr:cytochrome c oxidase assembly protein [Polyangiaceae bacterium]